jgi:hypothetical protein
MAMTATVMVVAVIVIVAVMVAIVVDVVVEMMMVLVLLVLLSPSIAACLNAACNLSVASTSPVLQAVRVPFKGRPSGMAPPCRHGS